MKTIRMMVPAMACAVAVLVHGMAFAAPGTSDTAGPLKLLGTPVPIIQLGGTRARGEIIISASNDGGVSGNQVGAGSVTGTISDTQSIANNSGITTVMQNTGNNALLQNSTSIYVSAK